jgi:hypothetical protein
LRVFTEFHDIKNTPTCYSLRFISRSHSLLPAFWSFSLSSLRPQIPSSAVLCVFRRRYIYFSFLFLNLYLMLCFFVLIIILYVGKQISCPLLALFIIYVFCFIWIAEFIFTFLTLHLIRFHQFQFFPLQPLCTPPCNRFQFLVFINFNF